MLGGRSRGVLGGRSRWLTALLLTVVLLGCCCVVAALAYANLTLPAQTALPETTTLYYADATTVLARLGDQTRYVVDTRRLPGYVTGAVLSAEDRDFRRSWSLGAPSAIARSYARIEAGTSVPSRPRLLALAVKYQERYGKDGLLDRYLNTVYFGRAAYGIEAAALAYFDKSAKDLTVAEAAVLGGVLRSPGDGAYDPASHPEAARRRWKDVLAGMVDPLGVVARKAAAAATYPTVIPLDQARSVRAGWPTGPTGLIVGQVLAELSHVAPFARPSTETGLPGREIPSKEVFPAIANGGYRIVTTIDSARQQSLEHLADETAAGSVMAGQPANLQAAAVAVEPGSGRVLAYYGGGSGTGFDFAGMRDGPDGVLGGGVHPPGGSFGMYTLAAALSSGYSVKSMWRSPATEKFPQLGIRALQDTARCPTGADVCSLADAAAGGLKIPMFSLATKLGVLKLVTVAYQAGIDRMSQVSVGAAVAVPVELRVFASEPEVRKNFGYEVAFGEYPISVLDHANGAATFAAGGVRAKAHFVTSVSRGAAPSAGHGAIVQENRATRRMDITQAQIDDLTWAMSRTPAAALPGGRPSAALTGVWQTTADPSRVGDAWITGFTPQLAMAVWVGNKHDELPLVDRDHVEVTGATLPAAIYRGFLSAALVGTPVTPFRPPTFGGDPAKSDTQR